MSMENVWLPPQTWVDNVVLNIIPPHLLRAFDVEGGDGVVTDHVQNVDQNQVYAHHNQSQECDCGRQFKSGEQRRHLLWVDPQTAGLNVSAPV